MKKILVIDDDIDLLDATAFVLEAAGYTVATAVDGRKGLEEAAAMIPDLIVLDLAMPGMHGFEVCEKLRKDEKFKDVKILIASGKSYPTDIKMATELGADHYMVKPLDYEKFTALIAEMLNGK